MRTRVFETGVQGLDAMVSGGVRWGSSFTIASDLFDRVTLCHQIVQNVLRRGFIVYYMCFKESPERARLTMKELNLNVEHYEKKRLLRFYTPLETELTRSLKGSTELLKVMDKFTKGMMKDVALRVIRGKKVLIVINNVSALYDMLHEDPRWKDFITKGSSWLRKLIKVISINIADLRHLEAAESIVDFCIVLKNIDGIPYIKVTKVSTSSWVPYRSTQNGIEVAEEFL